MAVGVFNFKDDKKNTPLYDEFNTGSLWYVESLDGQLFDELGTLDEAISMGERYMKKTGVPCVVTEARHIPNCYIGIEDDCYATREDFSRNFRNY